MARNWEHTARRIEADAIDDLAGHRKLQSPAGQEFVNELRSGYHTEKTAPFLPWLAREFRKGRVRTRRSLEHTFENDTIGRALPDEVKDALRLYDRHFVGALDEPPTHPGTHLGDLYNELTRDRRRGLLYHDPTIDPEEYSPWQHLRRDDVQHWGDWYSQPDRRNVPIEQLKVHELGPEVERYEQEKAKRQKEEEIEAGRRPGEVVHSFPDGWHIKKLPAGPALDYEAHCMGGICVNWPQYQDRVGQGHTLIYSLRDAQGNPHVTTEVAPKNYGLREEYEDVGKDPEDWRPQPPPFGDIEGHPNARYYDSERPVPHGGQIVQIQGNANSVPKSEYQARMKDWFQTFPEETRPNWEYEAPESMDHPADVAAYYADPDKYWAEQEEWINNRDGYGPHGDYGLAPPPKRVPEVNWQQATPKVLERDYGGHGPVFVHDRADALYKAALERREIPEFAKEVESFGDEQQNNFDEWLMMQPPDVNVPFYPDDAEEDSPAMRQYYEDRAEWEAEHAGLSASQHLYGLINQHWTDHGDGTGAYENPPVPHPTFSNVDTDPPVRRLWVFSPQSGQVHLHDENDAHPADAPTHESIAADLGETGLHHGYAYTIPGGWRVLDYHHDPVSDPFVLRTVVDALRKATR